MGSRKKPLSATRLRDYREGVKLLRRLTNDFRAEDGYDLRKIKGFSSSKLSRITRLAADARSIVSAPAVRFIPRKRSSVSAVRKHTGQRLPKQKVWYVPTPKPDQTKVEIKRGKLQTARQVRGGKVYDRYFYFPRRPKSFDDVIEMTEEMLPDMPKGFYLLMQSRYGFIGGGSDRDQLLTYLNSWFAVYDKMTGHEELGATILGFRWTGSTFAQHSQFRKTFVGAREAVKVSQNKQRAREIARIKKRLRHPKGGLRG